MLVLIISITLSKGSSDVAMCLFYFIDFKESQLTVQFAYVFKPYINHKGS